jgi:hypothetical protein
LNNEFLKSDAVLDDTFFQGKYELVNNLKLGCNKFNIFVATKLLLGLKFIPGNLNVFRFLLEFLEQCGLFISKTVYRNKKSFIYYHCPGYRYGSNTYLNYGIYLTPPQLNNDPIPHYCGIHYSTINEIIQNNSYSNKQLHIEQFKFLAKLSDLRYFVN